MKNSLLWFRALKRYEPLSSSEVYHFLVPSFNPETLSVSTEMLLKVITLQLVILNATVLSRKSENRSREAEKPQCQHTQQKCFPQFAAPRFFIWPHSEDKVRIQFQFGLCNRGCAELLVQRKSHSSPILALTRTHSYKSACSLSL